MSRLGDKEFYKTLVHLAVPIALQSLVASSLNMIDAIMVGQLGEKAIAGVGIANQVFFLLNLILFGAYSGASIFASQYWGKGDIGGVRTVLGICLKIGCGISLIFTLVCLIFPKHIIGLFNSDPIVIDLGVQFLTINAMSFVIMAISFCYAALSRSTGYVKLPMFASIIALSLNTVLNFLLIEGNLGFPSMGVRGASIATLISRIVEALIIVLVIYTAKHPVAAGLKELMSFDTDFLRKFIKTTLPVILHEGLWSLGVTFYTFIYGHMGTPEAAAMNVAALNIVSNIDRIALVLFFGLSNACAIMVGHKIGEGNKDHAYRDSGRLLIIGPLLGVATSIMLLLSYNSILSLFHVSADVKHLAAQVLTAMVFVFPIRTFNFVMIVGVARAGGDTKFSLFMEILPLWLFAIPLTALGGLYFNLPLIYVYLLSTTEEFIKASLGLRRYFSRKWIHNVTHT
ncbi:MAG: MATE family efflux transporter [Clostridia bacterium]|nr:MATE family efflux transporter [Clostridia bacterium]